MYNFRRYIILTLFIALICMNTVTVAQDWSKEQKEVWKTVEAYWDVAAKGDVAGFTAFFHDSFKGWNNAADVPDNKAARSKFIEYGLKSSENVLYTVTPATIWVKDNFAFVHYYYTSLDKDTEGKEKWTAGRWTDILMKDGNKWVMVGDHGGDNPKK